MRVYIINADDLIVSCEVPATPGENEIVVASLDECALHGSAGSDCSPCGTVCPVSSA